MKNGSIILKRGIGGYPKGSVLPVLEVVPHGGNYDCAEQYRVEGNTFVPSDAVTHFWVEEPYREVKTPQTPPCEHKWRSDWGFNGPIMVCEKCGSWEHD